LTNQSNEILDCKAPPEWILPSLRVIEQHSGRWKELWFELVKVARELDSTAKEDNIVSALINPTLRNLRLAAGDGEELRLSSDGRQCLEAFRRGSIHQFQKRLGYQIIYVDRNSANITSYLLMNHNTPETAISVSTLREELHRAGMKNATKVTPVQGWIRLMDYVSIVRKTKKGFYIIRSQFQVLKDGEVRPTATLIRKVFIETARKLKGMTQGSPYIPIPEFREHACAQLRISSFTFDEIVRQFLSDKQLRIVLSTPIRRVSGGITMNGKYYYFMAIYPR